MQKETKGRLFLIFVLYIILGGSLIYLRATTQMCEDFGCHGNAGCIAGFEGFIGCNQWNPCIGGGYIICAPPPPF